jgi:uncharacterized damage-inducible protein DinB
MPNSIFMLHLYVQSLLERDISKLREELKLYINGDDIWITAPGTSNSAGNLTLHLAGNLRHFIGAVLGGTGYVRDRDSEFSTKNMAIKELDALLEVTLKEITPVLRQLDPEVLSKEFPKEVGGIKRDTAYVLLHLAGHLSYHLGQVNYHRRILSSLKR